MAAVKKEYPNPRTSRNYIAGLKVMVQIPEVRQALGPACQAAIERKLHAELSDLNHESYQLTRHTGVDTPADQLEKLRKENEILRKMLAAIHTLTTGFQTSS